MKVALIGASGTGGSRLLAELNRRGHQVTAIARHPEKVAKHPGVTAEKGDVFDKPGLVALIKGHDAVISSVHFSASDPKLLIEAVKESGVKRYFVVGGAGSLETEREARAWVLLSPERVIEAEGPASEILRRCDGTRTVATIIDELAVVYAAEREVIAQDVTEMLADMVSKRLLAG